MEDSNSNPPPIPHRPGRVVQIQGIDSLRPEATPNEYVDTNTIVGAHPAPQRPPKLYKPDKAASINPKTDFAKDTEQHENIRNELREHLQDVCKQQTVSVNTTDSQSPKIPPRSGRPPPLPPRDTRGACNSRLQIRPGTAPASIEQQPTWQCNPVSQRPPTNPTTRKSPLPATVLIITEESRFPQFSTSRSSRDDKLFKNLISNPSQPVTQQPTAASNVTLTLGETGAVSNTIICPECGQCRCSDCTGNRKLPERWLCEGNCRCSADSVVDALSCMWCVKSCFKTIIDNPEGSRVNPCACSGSSCFLRWTALAALSLCLPCLCCYGPMRLGVAAATACYNCRKRGCSCEKE